LPASATAGRSEERAGDSGAGAGATGPISKEFGSAAELAAVAPDAGATAAGAVRGRAAVVFACEDAVGCAEVNRVMSSRMFRAASQPDNNNSPIAKLRLVRLLIVIPAYPKDLSKEAITPPYGLYTAHAGRITP
jgi:hypothetical protein